jgi:hypothetical protein
MSQPPPLPPDLPSQQPLPLAYGRPPSISIGGQAELGTVATVAPIVGISFVAAFAVGMASEIGNGAIYMILGVVCVATVGTGVLLARKYRRDPNTRGWAIGIYIGMGLAALFWGTCAMILVSLTNTNYH